MNDNNSKKNSRLGSLALFLAIIGMLSSCVVIGIIPSILGLICGIKAVKRDDKKKSSSIAAIACSLIGIGIFVYCWNAFGAGDSGSVGQTGIEAEMATNKGDGQKADTNKKNKQEKMNSTADDENKEKSEKESEQVVSEGNKEESETSENKSLHADELTKVDIPEERIVEIGINYNSRIFADADESTEITVYLDNIELGKINCGETCNYEIPLTIGKHTIKTRRIKIDKDNYNFTVEKAKENSIFVNQPVGLEYTYHFLTSNGELKEASRFPNSDDAHYYSVDIAAAGNDGRKLDESRAVELTDLVRNSETPKELAKKINDEYGIEFEKTDKSTYTAGKEMRKIIVSKTEKGSLMVICERTYDLLYVIEGIWCGMEYETAFVHMNEVSDEYLGSDEEEGMDWMRFGNDGIAIMQAGERVQRIIFYKNLF